MSSASSQNRTLSSPCVQNNISNTSTPNTAPKITSPLLPSPSGTVGQPSQANGSSSSFAQGSANNAARRPPMQPQGLGGMGGMGSGSVRPSGKSGLTFDHILSRLQGELQKSRETGVELHNLTGAMNNIHDTLGGSLPPKLPPYLSSLPPIQPPHQNQNPPEPTQPSTTALTTWPSVIFKVNFTTPNLCLLSMSIRCALLRASLLNTTP